jgi:hypothetical protein
VKLNNIHRLRPEVADDVRRYVEDLLRALGEDGEAVLAFGSATGPDYVPGQSDVNLALLVRTAEFSLLDRCLAPVAAGFKKRIVAPLFLTREYIARSQDVFPVEFLDMRETGVLLYGEDFLAGLELRPAWLRLECEQRLKSNLLRTRQAFLEIGRSKGGLERVLTQSLNSLVPLFRAMLTLMRVELPRTKREIVTALCRELAVADTAFNEILQLRAAGGSLKPGRGPGLLADYVLALDKLVSVVDTIEVEEAQ